MASRWSAWTNSYRRGTRASRLPNEVAAQRQRVEDAVREGLLYFHAGRDGGGRKASSHDTRRREDLARDAGQFTDASIEACADGGRYAALGRVDDLMNPGRRGAALVERRREVSDEPRVAVCSTEHRTSQLAARPFRRQESAQVRFDVTFFEGAQLDGATVAPFREIDECPHEAGQIGAGAVGSH